MRSTRSSRGCEARAGGEGSGKPGLLLIFGLLIGCAPAPGGRVEVRSYPIWFLEQGKLGKGYAVGYSRAYARRDTAVAEALRDAAWRMVRSQMVYVEAEQGFTEDALGKHFQGERYRVLVDTGLVEATAGRLKPLDVAEVGNMLIVLAGTGPPPAGYDARVPMPSAPPWTTKPPEEPGWVYAVGVAQRYFYLRSSWEYAERDAYLELARTVGLKVWDLRKSREGWSPEGVQMTESRAVLRGAEVVARWEDAKRGAFYVLVRMPFR